MNILILENYNLQSRRNLYDNFANFGMRDSIITQIENKKIVTMDFSTRWEYQNSKKIYFRGRRGNSDEDTGIKKVIVIGADKTSVV